MSDSPSKNKKDKKEKKDKEGKKNIQLQVLSGPDMQNQVLK